MAPAEAGETTALAGGERGARPTVSVVVPCYNGERYLGEALDSILAQSVTPAEIIVVDDGSTDGSLAVAARYAPPVRSIRQENRGASAARNAGAAAAASEFLAFLDADDLWPADSLALRLAPLLGDESLDAVFGAVEQFISPELDAETARFACPPGRLVARHVGATVLRRRMFAAVGPFDEKLRIGEMFDWVARAEAGGFRLGEIDALVMRRRIHGANSVIRGRDLRSDYLQALRGAIMRRRAMGASGSSARERAEPD